MAEALREAGAGHNLSRASFIEFCTKHEEVERELAEVAETRRSLNRRRKDLRKNMGAAGIDVEMFDRMRSDLELTPEERQAQAHEYARYMAWQQAPVGFQPSMDLQTDDPEERAYNVHELHAIDGEGFDSGRSGRRRDSNPYRPGSEPHQRWDNAWTRGQAAAVEAQMGTVATEPAQRRRGRPPRHQPNGNGEDEQQANGHAEDDAFLQQPEEEDAIEPPPLTA